MYVNIVTAEPIILDEIIAAEVDMNSTNYRKMPVESVYYACTKTLVRV